MPFSTHGSLYPCVRDLEEGCLFLGSLFFSVHAQRPNFASGFSAHAWKLWSMQLVFRFSPALREWESVGTLPRPVGNFICSSSITLLPWGASGLEGKRNWGIPAWSQILLSMDMFCAIWEFVHSRDCVAHSQNPKIVHYSCTISRLCNCSVQSPMHMCRNHLVVMREATIKWPLCVVLIHCVISCKIAESCELHGRSFAVRHTGEVRRLRKQIMRSWDCACTRVKQSPDCLLNLGILRMRKTISRLHNFSDCTKQIHSILWMMLLFISTLHSPWRVHSSSVVKGLIHYVYP